MRKLLILGALALGTLAVGAGPAAAAPCTPTPLFRDGHFLTAQLVNPAAVTGAVVATGCDIGVYVGAGAATTIAAADISDARYFGVAVQGSGASASISDSAIHDVGDDPRSGAQHGVGVYFTDGATGSVATSEIYDYQKNGMAITGAGTDVAVTDNRVIGDGPTKRIAQNGIQVSFGATANVTGNVVSDNIYTQNGNCAPEGVGSCVGVIATGILFYQAGADYDTGEIARANHAFRNQCNNCVID